MENKIKEIREACIKANPEIVELGWGCEVEMINNITDIEYTKLVVGDIVRVNDDRWMHCGLSTFNKDSYTIIGRPIRLADVLLAVNEADNPHSIDGDKDHENVMWKWNWKDDNLNNQSPETINFIHNLLKN